MIDLPLVEGVNNFILSHYLEVNERSFSLFLSPFLSRSKARWLTPCSDWSKFPSWSLLSLNLYAVPGFEVKFDHCQCQQRDKYIQSHWQALIGTVGHWRALTGTDRQWRALTSTDRHWQAVTGTERHCRALSATVGHWQALTGTDKHWQALSGTDRHCRALRGTDRGRREYTEVEANERTHKRANFIINEQQIEHDYESLITSRPSKHSSFVQKQYVN